jgi:hypothetical protein
LRKLLLTICSMAFIATMIAVATPIARAGIWDDATQVTFSAPFRVPGNQAFPAGTYWFLKVGTQRDEVQVWDAKHEKQLATVQGKEASAEAHSESNPVPPRDHSEFVFAKPNSGNGPMALVRWFNPGDQPALDFVYPDQERQQYSDKDLVTVSAQPTTRPHTGTPPANE